MKKWTLIARIGLVLGLAFFLILPISSAWAETPKEKGERLFRKPEGPLVPMPRKDIKVEMFLMKEKKKDGAFIKKLFKEQQIERVMIQYFRAGNPPKNLVLGRRIPADVGRMVIELALHYNNGITHLVPEFRFYDHYVAFGNSSFDIQAQIPISPEDLNKLRDESLSDEDFHILFRSLTGEDKGVSSYLD